MSDVLWTPPTKRPPDPFPSGTALQMALLRVGQTLGWLVKMDRRSHTCRTESDPGFPDLFFVKPTRWIFIECKSRYEKVGEAQVRWASMMGFGDGEGARVMPSRLGGLRIEYHIARPADYDRMLAVLQEG